MTARILLAALLALMLAAPAHADPTVMPLSASDEVDRIIDHALEPTIADPVVIVAVCPGDAESFGCTYAKEGSPIWITPGMLSRFALLHELGHRYQFDVMPADGLRRFESVMHLRQWTADTTEMFADAYASCALGWVPRRSANVDNVDPHFPTGYGYWPTRHQQDQVCDLIADAMP